MGAEEIYAHKEEMLKQQKPWSEDEENMENEEAIPDFLKSDIFENKNGVFRDSSEEFDSSEELTANEFSMFKINSSEDEGLDLSDEEFVEYIWNDLDSEVYEYWE